MEDGCEVLYGYRDRIVPHLNSSQVHGTGNIVVLLSARRLIGELKCIIIIGRVH